MEAALAWEELIDFRRSNTGMPRRVPLWTETVEVLDLAIANRPDPLDIADEGHAFQKQFGRPYVRFSIPGGAKLGASNDGIGQEFGSISV